MLEFHRNSDLCYMETNQLEVLARLVLPSEILDYFSIVSVEDSSSEIHIHLDELMNSELLLFRIAKLYGYPIKFLLHQNCLQEVAFGLVKGHFWGDKRWHFAYCTHNSDI